MAKDAIKDATDGNGEKGEKPEFSPRELDVMVAAWKCLADGEPPKVDNDKLASLLGMSNPRSASNAWTFIKKKIFADGTGETPKSTPKKRSKKAADEGGDEGEGTPAKKPRTPAKKKGKKATEEEEEEEEEEVKEGSSALVKDEVVEEDA